ncbi:adenosylcobinamide-GDP ribazoletransferase [Lachnospiraceae bacterium NSJ-143]|nr:adenosylcobinamide-GDP ribazoletransferase [Lachnospiraceae bacterium NSJ-143]
MLNSFFMALSMFSRLPVPEIDFKKANMKYALCFFPAVGLIIGFFQCLAYCFLIRLEFSKILISSVITVIPILITGGIHLDGFIDTSDARKSYAGTKKKLDIMSDPHTGAFGVICTLVYFVLYFGFIYEAGPECIYLFAKCFIISRCLSGIAAVSFKCAKKEGLLFTFSSSSDSDFTRGILTAVYFICSVWIVTKNGFAGVMCVLASGAVFVYYRYFSYKEFGGITGDLAGYFLQICELIMLMCAVVFCRA